jgi:uncharacterized protein DUF4145/DDE family transposase
MQQRVEANPALMKRRKQIVEHPFGTIKHWHDQGSFLMKGLARVRAEFSLSTLAYNLRRVTTSQAPMPHLDMPEEVRVDYDKARNIATASPRGAAALLRLVIQRLCRPLGENGRDLNQAIGALVQKGLPVEIQQALDIVRVIGNNAVHPGELRADDVAEVASTLFGLVNQIVEDRITRPKKLEALFEKLPPGARESIAGRDKGSGG